MWDGGCVLIFSCKNSKITTHCWTTIHRRNSNTVLAQSLWGLWVLLGTRFIWALPRVSGGYGVYSKCDFNSPPLTTMGYLFLVGSNILLSMFVQLWVVILEFLQEKMSSCPSTLPSCRLFPLAKPKRTGEWDGWNEGYEEGVIIPQLRLQYPLPGGREAWAPFCHPHSDHKGSACNAEYQGSIPGWGKPLTV